MSDISRFFATWELLADRSDYQLGHPPREGQYTIEQENDRIKVSMQWTTTDGQFFSQSYYAIPDGQDHPYHDSPAVDSTSMTVVSDTQLDSDAKKDGRVLNHAERHLEDDGRLMKVTMVSHLATGTFMNTAFYRRKE